MSQEQTPTQARPLEFATTRELIDELQARFPSLVFSGHPLIDPTDYEVYVRGNIATAAGLCRVLTKLTDEQITFMDKPKT